jgi:putative membrane protein
MRKHAGLGAALGVVLLAGCGMYGADRETTYGVRPAGAPPAGGYAAGRPPGILPPGTKDALFLAEAAHGSASELELSRLAVERARSQPVKDYAQKILDDHRAASQQLVELAQRKGHPIPSRASDGVNQRVQELRSGKPGSFERDYMARMVMDHTEALTMFRDVANSGQDADVRAWAASQVPVLEAHLKQAQALSGTLARAAEK